MNAAQIPHNKQQKGRKGAGHALERVDQAWMNQRSQDQARAYPAKYPAVLAGYSSRRWLARSINRSFSENPTLIDPKRAQKVRFCTDPHQP